MGRQSFCREMEILDFVTLAIQPLAAMDWFLATVTRRDALLGQHLTDFVLVIPLIPDHRCHRRQVLAQHTSTGEVTALPLTQVESQGTTLYCHRAHGACWSCPPWYNQSGGGHPPLLKLDAVGWTLMSVASIIRTSGSVASGGSAASDGDNSEKISSKTPLSHQRRKRVVEGFVGAIGSRGIHPAQPFPSDMDDATQHLPVIDPLPTPFLGEQGADAINLLHGEPQQLGHHPSPPGALLGVPRSRLVSGIIVTVSCCNQHKYLIRLKLLEN